MTAARFKESEASVNDNGDTRDKKSSNSSASNKLERRRRIEDINEERRLREELSEY